MKNNTKNAIFFLSTGRCGTQSIAHVLNNLCAEDATVVHEPIEFKYKPNHYFKASLDKFEQTESAEVTDHINEISNTLKNKHYIEAGWPCYSHIPYFIKLFGGQVKIVHLVRNPVSVAASLTTHGFYDPDNTNGFNVFGTLSPLTKGVLLEDYKSRWKDMTRFEKCLFHWAEINLYADWLSDRFPALSILKIRAEDLFADPEKTYKQLFHFAGLSWKGGLEEEKKKVDQYSRHTSEDINPALLLNHPEIIKIMEQFSYEGSSVLGQSINRYKKENKLKSIFKKVGF